MDWAKTEALMHANLVGGTGMHKSTRVNFALQLDDFVGGVKQSGPRFGVSISAVIHWHNMIINLRYKSLHI